MSDKIIPFDFGDSLFRSHIDEDGAFWFVAKDVCSILELDRTAASRLDDDEKGVRNMHTPGGVQEMLTVSESGLYHLIFKSRKEEAKKFRKWVTSEVLPALREHGCFTMPNKDDLKPSPALSGDSDHLKRLRPTQRTVALQVAAQVARMSGGNEEDVKRLFEEYGALLSAPVRHSSQLDENTDFSLFREWVNKHLVRSERRKQKRQRIVIQHQSLYSRYCDWMLEQDREPVSRIFFGRWMKNEMKFRYEKQAKGWYFVEWIAENPPLMIRFSEINSAFYKPVEN